MFAVPWRGMARTHCTPPNIIAGSGERDSLLKRRGSGGGKVVGEPSSIVCCHGHFCMWFALFVHFVINTVVPTVHFLTSLLFPVIFSYVNLWSLPFLPSIGGSWGEAVWVFLMRVWNWRVPWHWFILPHFFLLRLCILFKMGFFSSVGVCTDHAIGMAPCTVCVFSEGACWRLVSPGNKMKSP